MKFTVLKNYLVSKVKKDKTLVVIISFKKRFLSCKMWIRHYKNKYLIKRLVNSILIKVSLKNLNNS